MKILVTGATGFLGKTLVLRLLNLGHEVIGFGRNKQIGSQLETKGMRFISGDLTNEQTVIDVCEGIDVVFHCGALSSPWGRYEDFYEANVLGTKHVIKGCFTHHVKRLIHVSTPSLYFHYDNKENVKESDALPKQFVNHYAKTKYLAEKLIDEAFLQGLAVITIRPRAIFGPGDNAILPRLIQINQEKFIPLINGGNHVLDLTYVDNVVDALLLCMNSPNSTLGEKYNITNEEQWSLRNVLTETFDALHLPFRSKKVSYHLLFTLASCLEWISLRFQDGKEPFLTKYTVSVLSKSQTLCIEKAKRELGYTPKISVKEGIHYYAKWFNTHHTSVETNDRR